MADTLQQMKSSFIEYILFHYRFKSRISVWVLNYLKSSPESLQNIHFVDEIIPMHNTLEISVANVNKIAIRLSLKDKQLINNDEIFNYIIDTTVAFDIKLHFDQSDTREARLDELLINQLLNSPYYALYMQDIYSIPLTKQSERSIIHHLQANIDLSLQLHDRPLFYQLSQILNTFESRNVNSSMRE
ncbi:IDEAL domain-containing protein [Staphylococcus gallinarum]|uniref:IDEAL domain-containing protein n=1 Tax=Staphylococcus gallinarum TaxID=1293 RepID=A0A3A0W0N6_STAGA|nr:YpiB family protein [Staphylococcus gallinarum]RIP34304.1 IDEAL domain-containing protein [Staphylococcus gallinarum]